MTTNKLPLLITCMPRLGVTRFNQLRYVTQVKHARYDGGADTVYARKSDYDASRKDDRLKLKADIDSGLKPTNFQKRMLVALGLYDGQGKIPEYVPVQTMQRLHDRMRAFFYVFFTTVGITAYLTMKTWTQKKIIRDREDGFGF